MLLTDSYKVSHYKQYPPKTEKIYSYFESRGFKEFEFKETVFFGLQYFLKTYLEGVQITEEKIQEAKQFWNAHFGNQLFNEKGWRHILEKHDGKLPISIKAIKEGTVIGTRNVLMTVENTDPECFWLTNFLETLLVQIWYPTTVATLSREIKKIILKSLQETGDPTSISFKLHDFGFRGVSSVESAGIGGCAHLVNFMGTDTAQALIVAKNFYKEEMAGFSIPAAEHSTITSWGQQNEIQAFKNMLDQYPEGLVACVSDSYDIYHACAEIWGTALKDKILARNGTLVIRPDSGNPKEVILRCLAILEEKFGTQTNEKGYKELPRQVRLIQGDGVDLLSIKEILESMKENGWSANNIAFGMGGALLQKLNRDTGSFAFKCSMAVIDGKEVEVFKNPIGDTNKTSKRGRLGLLKHPNGFHTWSYKMLADPKEDQLEEVFKDGEVLTETSLSEIRERAYLQGEGK